MKIFSVRRYAPTIMRWSGLMNFDELKSEGTGGLSQAEITKLDKLQIGESYDDNDEWLFTRVEPPVINRVPDYTDYY